jgi:hypothetical protein
MARFDPTAPVETWYRIPSLPGYQVSSHYHARKVKRDPWSNRRVVIPLKIMTTDKGYLSFPVSPGRRYRLHRAIAEVVYGPIPADAVVRHLDDDKLNNHPSNLAIGTHTDNMRDASRNGRFDTPARKAAQKLGTLMAQTRRGKIPL